MRLISELDRRLSDDKGTSEGLAPRNDLSLTLPALKSDISRLLHDRVVAMNVDNFVVRPHLRWVEKFADPKAWERLDAEKQLAVLGQGGDFTELREKIQRIAALLELQMAIPAIKAEELLIRDMAGDEWWEGVNVPMLEIVRRKLRALIKLIPKGKKFVVYTNFEDEVGEGSYTDLLQSGSTSTPNQIEFIQLLIEELTRSGAMEPERLFQSPFTDINAKGPQAVFPGDKFGQLLDVLRQFTDSAVA